MLGRLLCTAGNQGNTPYLCSDISPLKPYVQFTKQIGPDDVTHADAANTRLTRVCYCSFSAGVGRSGTFIVIDAMLDRIKAEKTVDIFNYVAYLRSRRTAMVQTEVRKTVRDIIIEPGNH